MKSSERITQLKHDWYANNIVKYQICPNILNRTFDLITPRTIADANGIKRNAHRYLKVNSHKGLDFNISKFEVVEKFRNLYCSVASIDFKDFPVMSLDFKQEEIQRKYVNDNFEKYVTGYDLVFDIDNEDIDKAHECASKVKKVLDEYNVPYWMQFSGNKGFHLTINTKHIDANNFPILKRPELFKQLATNLAEKFEISSLDLGIYNIGRVIKCPYSIVINKEHPLIALPLDDYQFDNFDVDDVKLKPLMSFNTKIMNRGLLERKGTKENVSKFIDTFTKQPKQSMWSHIKDSWRNA